MRPGSTKRTSLHSPLTRSVFPRRRGRHERVPGPRGARTWEAVRAHAGAAWLHARGARRRRDGACWARRYRQDDALQLAVGLAMPSVGVVRVFGSPRPDARSLLPRVGFVAQEDPHYRGFGAAEMLRFGRKLNPSWQEVCPWSAWSGSICPSGRRERSSRAGNRSRLRSRSRSPNGRSLLGTRRARRLARSAGSARAPPVDDGAALPRPERP